MDASTRGELLQKLADLIERDALYIAVSKLKTKTKLHSKENMILGNFLKDNLISS